MNKPDYKLVIEELKLLEVLADYSPVVIGTPPLGIAINTSDIDIACEVEDIASFENLLFAHFGSFEQFKTSLCSVRSIRSFVCSFQFMSWTVEIFGQPVPIYEQYGVRHFHIEKRLLDLCGHIMKTRIINMKKNGMKTEPAFASTLITNFPN